MRTRFSIVLVLSLLGSALVAPAAWADSHGEIVGIQWLWAQLTETEPAAQSVVPNPEDYTLVLNADGSAIRIVLGCCGRGVQEVVARKAGVTCPPVRQWHEWQ